MLTMWIVYDHPRDFPDNIDASGQYPSVEIERNPDDAAKIVEVWL
jgi:hypothetical protein